MALMDLLLEVQTDWWVTLFLVACTTVTDAPTVTAPSAKKVLQSENKESQTHN